MDDIRDIAGEDLELGERTSALEASHAKCVNYTSN